MKPGLPKLLVIDDEPKNLFVVKQILEDIPLEIVEARSGHEALSKLIHDKFFLILMDVQMPDMNGFETAKLILGTEKDADTPIIFVTALHQGESKLQGYDAGAVDYLHKPIVPEILINKVSIFQRLWSQQAALIENTKELVRVSADLNMQNIALEASNKSLQDFSRVVSHDLKQPLSTMIGFSRILKRREFDNLSEKGKDMLQRTINTSERMSRLIDSILGYAVLDDDTSQFGDVDLNEVFRDVIDDLEVAIRNSNANIEISPLNTVVGSSGQLYQMVQNIVNNALKYSRENVSPVITVSSKIISKGDCEITIADNGRGFDSTESERMFRPFCRLDNTDGVEGFGIGLGTVNKIVELHGGRVAAEGEPGVGATFFITLPLATPDPEQQSIH